jgi:hypothetical protein
LVKRRYHIQKYENAVDLFKIKSTGGLASNPVVNGELVILDKNGEETRLYGDDWSGTPRASWRNLGRQLEIVSGKLSGVEWHSRGRRFDPDQLHQILTSMNILDIPVTSNRRAEAIPK